MFGSPRGGRLCCANKPLQLTSGEGRGGVDKVQTAYEAQFDRQPEERSTSKGLALNSVTSRDARTYTIDTGLPRRTMWGREIDKAKAKLRWV